MLKEVLLMEEEKGDHSTDRWMSSSVLGEFFRFLMVLHKGSFSGWATSLRGVQSQVHLPRLGRPLAWCQ
ncbi:hypothetical protein MLD38_019930 [Melastoma candidum]|uniref:Uncharacterized protein n=1 Tax=Melastoma candidum TaxID=119954 RepID=A0ACB9QEB0_9MYRT|nr:hypothetical protein MLD38_019930 [Melastoma candidum]